MSDAITFDDAFGDVDDDDPVLRGAVAAARRFWLTPYCSRRHVVRDTPPPAPRPLRVGDIIRDHVFPLVVFRVSAIEHGRATLMKWGDNASSASIDNIASTYEHADGASIAGMPADACSEICKSLWKGASS